MMNCKTLIGRRAARRSRREFLAKEAKNVSQGLGCAPLLIDAAESWGGQVSSVFCAFPESSGMVLYSPLPRRVPRTINKSFKTKFLSEVFNLVAWLEQLICDVEKVNRYPVYRRAQCWQAVDFVLSCLQYKLK
ncbi:uncharacterized protein Dsimw501_GD28000, isoform B [Drosophila simulans]|uniref:Uncharacterized protein, isoform B n=1 Tax=Drosophila simulans TaxID=7240 RepID=A0A0J9RYN6_DROSI|nr:uncharacterized protein Dsimw501_GD28000, isoform B [Drosophila simulans]